MLQVIMPAGCIHQGKPSDLHLVQVFLACLLCLSLVWYMCTCLNLLHILHSEANTLQWYTQFSRITVRYNNGSIVDKVANTNAVCLCVC